MDSVSSFWIAVAVIVVAIKIPSWFKAAAEYRCEHNWDLMDKGSVVENIGTTHEKRVGYYRQFRCTKCGADREYR